MLLTSLKNPAEAAVFRWFPESPNLDQYFRIFDAVPMGRYLLNTIKITVLVIVGRLAVSALAGFALARLAFPGRKQIFAYLIGTMLLPVVMAIIPLFLAYKEIGWLDTHWPLIIPSMVTSGFGAFWMRQFFLSVPQEIEDAAVLDGAGPFRIMRTIMLPMATPHLAALGMLTAISTWNEFFFALIILNSPENYTVSVGLAYFSSTFTRDLPIMMAAAMITILPLFLLYVIGQRRMFDYMMEGSFV
jgi:multiple sugar transport system permease protein